VAMGREIAASLFNNFKKRRGGASTRRGYTTTEGGKVHERRKLNSKITLKRMRGTSVRRHPSYTSLMGRKGGSK